MPESLKSDFRPLFFPLRLFFRGIFKKLTSNYAILSGPTPLAPRWRPRNGAISLAGTEASGTGNMKFALNGALTIGTMDGANVEIHDAVGKDNIFIFGMTVEEVNKLRVNGYRPQDFIDASPRLKRVLELIRSGFFSPGDIGAFKPILETFLYDTYMVAADFDAYYKCQQKVSEEFLNRDGWMEKAVVNIANMGRFSSDRSIKDYARDIWNLQPCPVKED